LLRSDLAVESLFAVLKENPVQALRLLLGLVSRRRDAVAMIERCWALDAAHLPYHPETLARIKAERQSGTPVVLVSGRYGLYAQEIARHLRMFDRVIVPDDAGGGSRGSADIASKLEREAGNEPILYRPPPARGRVSAWLSAVRLHQWLKNLLIFVPLFASHWFRRPLPLLHAVLAFVLFGLCASSVYLLNDLLDIADDRHHPTKRFRALADGRIGVHAVLWAVPLLFLGSLAGAWWLLPPHFSIALLTYYAVTLAYSLWLKRIMMLDVVILAMLYTLRMVGGALAIDSTLTFWMLAFSLFIFMSLALAKRYAEMLDAQTRGVAEKIRGRGYFKSDLPMISALGAASGYLSVMVLALYIQDQKTVALYTHPQMIWFACPLLLFWIGRTWMQTHRGRMHDDPLVYAIRDRTSLVVAALFGLVFVLAA
jgi:4-hydroxybenzoate polyprenyltransferase